MADESLHQVKCWICGKDVWLRSCKIDERGHAVHEECYVTRMKLKSEPGHTPNEARSA